MTPSERRAALGSNRDDWRRWLASEISRFLDVTPAAISASGFAAMGFDSLRSVDFKVLLEGRLGLALPSTLLYDHPDLERLAEHLLARIGGEDGAQPSSHAEPPTASTPPSVGAQEIESSAEESASPGRVEISIVGTACRMPGSLDDPDALFAALLEGRDVVGPIPSSRWRMDRYHSDDRHEPGRMYVREGGFLRDDIETFDAKFFGMAPKEARELDPQQRVLLEVVSEAFERAGERPSTWRGRSVGVFVGTRGCEYFQSRAGRDAAAVGPYYGTGNSASTAAGRISYVFGFTGPSFVLDTACSSALVALHQAVVSLRRGECEAAIVASVNLLLDPLATIATCKAGMLAADGRCRTFDASASGYVRSEGAGALLLLPRSTAERHGLSVLATVLGTAINQDGASGGLTVPHGPSQAAVIRAALRDAKIDAAAVQYIEAHGTGTSLGDPTEVGALDEVFGRRGPGRLWVGSLKTNLGHLEPAAGIAGLLKLIHVLRSRIVPPNLHFREPNPHIPWDTTVVRVPVRPETLADGPAIGGTSSFGFSGTNAHAILGVGSREETAGPSPRQDFLPLLLSTKTPEALPVFAQRLGRFLEQRTQESPSLADVANTLARGREPRAHRLAFVARDRSDATASLLGMPCTTSSGGARIYSGTPSLRPKIAFLFTGQGSQRAGMGCRLLERVAPFRRAIGRCATFLDARLPRPLTDLLTNASDTVLSETRCTQPVLFAFAYGLAESFRAAGVIPDVVLGHSIGEIAAATCAGIFSLEDGLRLVEARGRLMAEHCPAGAMLAVDGGAAEISEHLVGLASAAVIAVRNAADRVVLAGPCEAIDAAAARLTASGIANRRLAVSHGFHSPTMEPMLAPFEDVLAGLDARPPTIPLISCLTDASDPTLISHWVEHVRGPVRFDRAVAQLFATHAPTLCIEIGPRGILTELSRRTHPHQATNRVVGHEFEDALARVFVAGLDLDVGRAFADRPIPPVSLPTHPFLGDHFGYEMPTDQTARSEGTRAFVSDRLRSPALEAHQTVVRMYVSEGDPTWMGDHRVRGRAVFPAAAYMSVFHQALALTQRSKAALSELSIEAPILLDTGRTEIQVIVDETNGQCSLHSSSEGGEWTRHATVRAAEASREREDDPPRALDVSESVEEFYDRHERLGLQYGTTFRAVREIRRRDGAAWGRVTVPGAALATPLDWHPIVLDAGFQLIAAAIPDEDDEISRLPIGAELVSIDAPLPTDLFVEVTLRSLVASGEPLVADLRYVALDGATLGRVRGLRLVRVGEDEAREDPLACTSRPMWREAPLARGVATGEGPVLIVGTPPRALGSELDAARVPWIVRSSETSDAELSALFSASYRRVVLTSSREPRPESGILHFFRVVRAAITSGGPTPSWMLVTDDPCVIGAARVLRSEFRDSSCRTVSGARDDAEAWLAEILWPDQEDEVRYDAGRRFTLRLARGGFVETPAFQLRLSALGGPLRLDENYQRIEPGPQDVLVRMLGVGINFKDVLHAYGVLASPAPNGQTLAPPQIPLGVEGVGWIEALGDGIRDLHRGDLVLVADPCTLRSHVTVPRALVTPSPMTATAWDAAGLQTVFMTAWHALIGLANVQPGERVLIHGVFGGVGRAATAVCASLGARVIGSASEWKRKSLDPDPIIEALVDSRSTDFEREVLRVTNGERVDVVLNSLVGEAIPASLRLLRPGGRFVELGKRDVWTRDRIAALRPDITAFRFELAEEIAANPAVWIERLDPVLEALSRGEFQLPPVRCWNREDAWRPFAELAAARSAGKEVVRLTNVEEIWGPVTLRADGTYVVSGGLGELGRVVCRWLVERGARHLTILGRRAVDPAEVETSLELPEVGAEVRYVSVNIADVAAVREALGPIDPPIRGVLHLAGILDDGLLANMTEERIRAVLSPKVHGTLALDAATSRAPLDFFWMFGSMSATLGPPGQLAYSAGNAFLEEFARVRRRSGRPAVTIAWGPWAEVGMAARMTRDQRRLLERRGLRSVSPRVARNVLDRLLDGAPPVVCVQGADWDRFVRHWGGRVPSLYLDLVQPRPSSPPSLQGRVEVEKFDPTGDPEVVRQRLGTLVRTHVLEALGFPSDADLDPHRPFRELGVDSLMTVDVRNRLERSVGRSLPVSLLLDHPNAHALVAHLSARLGPTPSPANDAIARTAELMNLDESALERRLFDLLDGQTGDSPSLAPRP